MADTKRSAFAVLAALAFAAAATSLSPAGDRPASWTQWGGPGQDFRAAASGLANEWPEGGPRELWSRELGEGYSAVLVEGGRLYTMYRDDEQKHEVVVSLDAKTGKTLWEHRYEASPAEGHISQFGNGPRSTPLISGDRLYTIGVSGALHCLNKTNGKVLWSHDLWNELGGSVLDHGYSSSPIEYKNTIITLVGGEGHGLIAFNKKNGKIAWKNLDFKNSYSTPRIFRVHGKDLLVTFMADALIGVDPSDGSLHWSYPHKNQWEQNIAMPSLVDGYLFLSSPQAGAKGLRLTEDGDGIGIEEAWSTRKIQFYHVTTVRDGEWIYGSTGTMGPAFLAAVNAKTGQIGWRERGYAKANCVAADGKLFVLDEDGVLSMTTATPDSLSLHAQATVLDKVAWTVPTIVGTTMYVRDKTKIVALDLG